MSDPKNTPDAEVLDDARDRLVDRVLAEAIGGETPPDLSASIRERAEERKAEVPGAIDSAKRGRALRRLAGVGAVAALLLVTVSLVPSISDPEEADVVAFGKAPADVSEPAWNRYAGTTKVEAPQVGDLACITDKIELPFRQGSFGTPQPESAEGQPYFDYETDGVPQPTDRLVAEGIVTQDEVRRRDEKLAAKPASAPLAPGQKGVVGSTGPVAPQSGSMSVPRPVWRNDVPAELGIATEDFGLFVDQPARAPSAQPAPAVGGSDGREVLSRVERESSVAGTDFGYLGTDNGGWVEPRFAGRAYAGEPAVPAAPRASGRVALRAINGRGHYAARDADGDLGDLDQSVEGLHRRSLHHHWSWRERQLLRREQKSGERYTAPPENEFTTPVGGDALSTFSVDVDTASYTNLRRFLLRDRQTPPPAAVRIEELVNYFDYGYAAPATESEDPFAASMEVGACPWKPEHKLVRIGIQGRRVDADKRPLSNLVFLVDVSGSMNSPDKLPLVVAGLEALTDRLGENDRVAIAVYAGSEGLVLPSTSGLKKDEIRSALGRLQAGGSTAGGAGLRMACNVAERNKIPGGVNRVVLCTDGDFNVGLTGTEELAKLVETRARDAGIFMTVLGFGRGNLNDAMLEAISGRGDGHYAYIDSEREARKVLSRDLAGTLVTIAKDVKLQVEFNPAKVASYRLIGYENRVLAAKDFNDDTKDAGEIGAGHTVTALYEIVPVGVEKPAPPIDGLKYQQAASSGQPAEGREPEASAPGAVDEPTEFSNELLTLKIRYKQPTGGASKKLEFPLVDASEISESAGPSNDFRWSAAVAEFGLLMRDSRHAGEASLDHVLETAREAIGQDPHGQRAEFLDMVRTAKEVSRQ